MSTIAEHVAGRIAATTMRIVAISDTHGRVQHLQVPPGDVLVHAGDATMGGSEQEVREFAEWFQRQPHRHKIFVAGNHDWLFQEDRKLAERILGPDIIYLQDNGVTIDGMLFYGSPWQPEFNSWAFNMPRDGEELRSKWDLIPGETDVLITHCPPARIFDMTQDGDSAGCNRLRDRIEYVNPKIHIFGHIHEGYGVNTFGDTTFINACICDERFAATRRPIVTELGIFPRQLCLG